MILKMIKRYSLSCFAGGIIGALGAGFWDITQWQFYLFVVGLITVHSLLLSLRESTFR